MAELEKEKEKTELGKEKYKAKKKRRLEGFFSSRDTNGTFVSYFVDDLHFQRLGD